MHIRIKTCIHDVLVKALRLSLPFFQCFLTSESNRSTLSVSREDMHTFLIARHRYFNNLYIHGSYCINGAGNKNSYHPILVQELYLAQKLEFTHFILHLGSIEKSSTREEGIDNLVRLINRVLKTEHNISIVLENSAHKKRCLGGDLEDLACILHKVEYPERLMFCIDTAHAHACGYTIDFYQEFITYLDNLLGIEKIALIHLNDTAEVRGSGIDCHAVIGEGVLGWDTLMGFVNHVQMQNTPVLVEFPSIPEQKERYILKKMSIYKEAHNENSN